MKHIKLRCIEIKTLVNNVSLSNQQRRLLDYVANNPKSLTLAVNRAIAIGNCSAMAKRVNKKLLPLGYVIACFRPINSISNRFGEPSQMYEWSLFKLPQRAANDSCYDSVREVSK
jgi:hypothetical protein